MPVTATLHPVEVILGNGFALPSATPGEFLNVPPTDLNVNSVPVIVEWLAPPFALVRIASGTGAGAIGVVRSDYLSN